MRKFAPELTRECEQNANRVVCSSKCAHLWDLRLLSALEVRAFPLVLFFPAFRALPPRRDRRGPLSSRVLLFLLEDLGDLRRFALYHLLHQAAPHGRDPLQAINFARSDFIESSSSSSLAELAINIHHRRRRRRRRYQKPHSAAPYRLLNLPSPPHQPALRPLRSFTANITQKGQSFDMSSSSFLGLPSLN